jgi:hypothetical protein
MGGLGGQKGTDTLFLLEHFWQKNIPTTEVK